MRDFAEKVALEIRTQTEMDTKVFVKDMPDGSKKYGVTIMEEDSNVAPTIYVEGFKAKGLTVEQTAKEILQMYDKAMEHVPDVSQFTEWENVKERLVVRLMPETFNTEVKRSAMAYGFDDLILVPYVDVENGSIKVLKEHIEHWGVTKRKVIDTAIRNTKNADITIKPMGELVTDIFGYGDEYPDILDRPLIVTNENGMFGASAILGAMNKIKKANKDGFYILPSSVHEVIVMPANMGTKEEFDMMVDLTNKEVVDPTERLSNHAYAFN